MKNPITLNGKTIFVTGPSGFIGANLVILLLNTLSCGTVVSIDNINDYYEVSLTEWRLSRIEKAVVSLQLKHIFIESSIGDKALIDRIFRKFGIGIRQGLRAFAVWYKDYYGAGADAESRDQNVSELPQHEH